MSIESDIHIDPASRGLSNLFELTRGELHRAVDSILRCPEPQLAIVTGFPILSSGIDETDGPIGSFFLARISAAMQIPVTLLAENSTADALEFAIEITDSRKGIRIVRLDQVPPRLEELQQRLPSNLSHLIAIERVGPAQDGRCYNMRGKDITNLNWPAHLLFSHPNRTYTTIGIGDGGNEIGMGKLPLSIIAENIQHGETIGCRVPTDHLIVAGLSNWGAYALAMSMMERISEKPTLHEWFTQYRQEEETIWKHVLMKVPLVDGLTGVSQLSVDGLEWEDCIRPLWKYQ